MNSYQPAAECGDPLLGRPIPGTGVERTATDARVSPAPPKRQLNDSERHRSRDGLAVYLNDISRIPLLTREQERTLAIQIAGTRKKLRRCLLSNEHVMRRIASALTDVLNHRRRADQVMEMPIRDADRRTRRTELAATHLETLNNLLAENREDFRLAASRRHSSEEKAQARMRMRKRRKTAMQLLMELDLRWEFLEETRESLLRLARTSHRLQQQMDLRLKTGNVGKARRVRAAL